MIYLLHSTVPLGTSGSNSASHYLGHCEEDALMKRVRQHQSGNGGAKITEAFVRAGGRLLLAWVLPGGTRDDERKLKTAGHFASKCTICQGSEPREDQ